MNRWRLEPGIARCYAISTMHKVQKCKLLGDELWKLVCRDRLLFYILCADHLHRSQSSGMLDVHIHLKNDNEHFRREVLMHQIIFGMNSLSIIFVGCHHHGKLLLVLFKWRGCDVIKCRYSQFSKYVEYCRRKSKRNDPSKLFQIHLQCSFYLKRNDFMKTN